MRKSAIAIFAHPDDIEFVAAGTLLLLAEAGWEIHYMNLSRGNCGSVQFDPETTAKMRLQEGKNAAQILGAKFYGPIANDLEIIYSPALIKKVSAAIRESQASIVLTHSPQDYMEDHMNTSRLVVTAAFTHAMPNFESDPPTPVYEGDVTVYHALPHGLRDPLRKLVRAGLYVDTSSVHERKREALAAHESQKHWLDVSQGMDSYLVSMDESAAEVGKLSGKYRLAEGWRRHLHLGFSAREIDPLAEALAGKCWLDPSYESGLEG